MHGGLGDGAETGLVPCRLFPVWLDWICCVRGGASAQQPGQPGGVGFSAEDWDIRQESSSQEFQGRKDLADKVFMSLCVVLPW